MLNTLIHPQPSFRQPHHSCLDSPPHPLLNSISVIIPTLVIHHSFTLSLQAQNLPFQQIRPTIDSFYLLDCLILFLVSHFNFLFIACGRLSWLPISFLLHVKYTLSYHIITWDSVVMTKDRFAPTKLIFK